MEPLRHAVAEDVTHDAQNTLLPLRRPIQTYTLTTTDGV
jgi:hypothetical protein